MTGLPLWGGSHSSNVLQAQVALDRAGFSPGEIDGIRGPNLERAVRGFQEHRHLRVTGELDAPTATALQALAPDPLRTYRLTDADFSESFEEVPADIAEQAKLKKLGYQSAVEALGERFHASPGLLRKLNRDKALEAGVEWMVPDVGQPVTGKVATVEVSESQKVLRAFDSEGKLLAQYPVTTGSEHDPLPIGEWKVTGVYRNPKFYYNPELFWDADPSHSKATIAPGPNNPVGVVWIDLTKEHYGIHGTPEPAQVGHVASHGCIRLTNWDATELANMVAKGVVARFVK